MAVTGVMEPTPSLGRQELEELCLLASFVAAGRAACFRMFYWNSCFIEYCP